MADSDIIGSAAYPAVAVADVWVYAVCGLGRYRAV